MVTLDQVREIALGLPEAEESPHHDMPSFRVRGKIFATVPDRARLDVMLASDEVPLAVAMSKRAVAELWWGKRLSGVTVNLRLASRTVVSELLEQAWRRRAPKMLTYELDGRRGNDELEPVLDVLRTWPELTSKGRANFHVKGRAFLHFHQSKSSGNRPGNRSAIPEGRARRHHRMTVTRQPSARIAASRRGDSALR